VPKSPDNSIPQTSGNDDYQQQFEENLFPNKTSEEIRAHELQLLREDLYNKVLEFRQIFSGLSDEFPDRTYYALIASAAGTMLSPYFQRREALAKAASDLAAALRFIEAENAKSDK